MAKGTTVISSLPAQDDVDDADLYAPNPITDEEPPPDDDHSEPERPDPHQLEAEQIARRQGWKPLAEYTGPPGKWKTAEEFLRVGREINPILQRKLDTANATIDRMGNETASLRAEMGGKIDQLTQQVRDLLSQNKTADQRGYDRAMAELRRKARDAASTGDVSAYDAVSEEISALEEERIAAVKPAPEPAPETARPKVEARVLAPEVEQFMQDNSWMEDVELNSAMQGAHMKLLREAPGLPLAENLKRAKEEVMRRYPDKFGLDEGGVEPPRSRRERAPVSTPGARPPAGESRPRGIDRIEDQRERAQARIAYQRMREANPDVTEAIYMRVYENPHLDVLDLIREAREARARK
jgi:uncharacterized protein YukE